MMAEDMIADENSGSSRVSDTSVMIMAVSPKLMLLVVLMSLLGACGTQVNAEREVAQTSQTAQAQYAAQTSAPDTDTRRVIAAFGDSLSAGYGVEPGKSFPDDLQRLLDAAGYQYRVVNLGVSGDTTTDGVERLSEVLGRASRDRDSRIRRERRVAGITCRLGQKNLAKMIEGLRAANIEILLAGMTLPRNYGPEYIQSFEQMYMDLAKEYKLARIPFLLEGVGGHEDLTQPDGIHPTAEGDRIVARTVMKYLRPLIHK